jgi:hypothetical protein
MRAGRYLIAGLTIAVGAACGGRTESLIPGDAPGDGGTPVVTQDAGEMCNSVEGASGSCVNPGDTCPFFVGAAMCGGLCICQSDLTWSCSISCGGNTVEAGVEDVSVVTAEAAVFDAPTLPGDETGCCLDPGGQDGQNLQYSTVDTVMSPPVAWEYVPPCTFDASYIALHDTGGPVGILDDTGGNPGPNLWTSLLPYTYVPTWKGIEIVPPVHLVAGHSYFIYEGYATASIASGGTIQMSWVYDPMQGRQGPFYKYPYTFRITGVCN